MEVATLIIGILFGYFVSKLAFKPKVVGTLKANYDDEGAYLFLEVKDMPYIETHDHIVLKVDLSQK